MARPRAYYEEAIKAGRTVGYVNAKGQTIPISRLEDIPPDSELGKGDTARLEASREALRREISEKQLELQRVEEEIAKAATQPQPAGLEANDPKPPPPVDKPPPLRTHDDKGGKSK